KQQTVTEDERAERGGERRERYPNRRERTRENDQKGGGNDPEEPRRQVGTDGEEHRGYTKHRGKLGATGLKELLKRRQKHTECINRPQRKAHDGRCGERRRGPRTRADVGCRHALSPSRDRSFRRGVEAGRLRLSGEDLQGRSPRCHARTRWRAFPR